jgi:4-amino-4-deoxy-L-arabinose transferase-like glycosyltransferase
MVSQERMNRLLLVAAIMLLGLVLRVGAIIYLHSWDHPGAMEHRAIAGSLLLHGEFNFADFGYLGPSSVQSPPYPALLAGLYWLFGFDSPQAYFAAMLINALAASIGIGLMYVLVRRWGGGERVGLTAAVLLAVWPTQVYAASFAQAIALITTGTLAILVLFDIAVRSGSLWAWIGFSLVGTLSALTEPVLLPLMALSGLLIFGYRRLPLGVRTRNAAILLLAAIVVIGPWTLRNRRVHGEWIPIKSTFWVNVWKGNNPYATGTDRLAMSEQQKEHFIEGMTRLSDTHVRAEDIDHQYERLTPAQRARLEGQPEAVREHVFQDIATTWIKAHPARYLQLCGIRLVKSLWIDWDNPKSYKLPYIVSRALLLLICVPGLWLAWRRRWSLGYAALLFGLCLLTYTLTITAARFALPLEPLQLGVGALFLVAVAAKLRQWMGNPKTAIPMGHEIRMTE